MLQEGGDPDKGGRRGGGEEGTRGGGGEGTRGGVKVGRWEDDIIY